MLQSNTLRHHTELINYEAINITYSKCVSVALVIQHAICMCHIIVSYVASLAPPYFSTSSHKQHYFWKQVTESKMCVSISLYLLSKTFLILRTEQDMIMYVHRSSCKVRVILVNFSETWIFLTDFQKILKYQILQKSIQWEPHCSMQTDKQA
jgi:hypothetical protein